MNLPKSSTCTTQAIAALIEIVNTQRHDNERICLQKVAKDALQSRAQIENARESIHELINSNRGGAKGLHGFIGERAQVGICNSRHIAKGQLPEYVLIDDNGPVDYVRNNTPIQQKACESGHKLSLDHILRHNANYPNFARSGGVYQIPRDQYETYRRLLSVPQSSTTSMLKPEYRKRSIIRRFKLLLHVVRPGQ